MVNDTTLDLLVEAPSQKRRSDLIADRLQELNGQARLETHMPIVPATPLLPNVSTILCTDEAGLLFKISYDKKTRKVQELHKYQEPIEMRADVERMMHQYNANKGSSIAFGYVVPEGVSGYHSLPQPMTRFLNGFSQKYE